MQLLPVHSSLTGIIDRACLTENHHSESYTVLPSVHTVLGFQFSGQIHHVAENRPLHSFGVTGILETRRVFRSEAKTRSLLIFLKPGGFYRIFGTVAAALGSNSLALSDIYPAGASKGLTDILFAPLEPAKKWNKVQQQLLKFIHRELSPESRAALYYLQAEQGLPRIEDIAKKLSVSRRTLERKFTDEIGTPPKHLARILRWQETLRNLNRFADLGSAALAHGYFDQAHFVRETQNFAGTSPKKLMSAGF